MNASIRTVRGSCKSSLRGKFCDPSRRHRCGHRRRDARRGTPPPICNRGPRVSPRQDEGLGRLQPQRRPRSSCPLLLPVRRDRRRAPLHRRRRGTDSRQYLTPSTKFAYASRRGSPRYQRTEAAFRSRGRSGSPFQSLLHVADRRSRQRPSRQPVFPDGSPCALRDRPSERPDGNGAWPGSESRRGLFEPDPPRVRTARTPPTNALEDRQPAELSGVDEARSGRV